MRVEGGCKKFTMLEAWEYTIRELKEYIIGVKGEEITVDEHEKMLDNDLMRYIKEPEWRAERDGMMKELRDELKREIELGINKEYMGRRRLTKDYVRIGAQSNGNRDPRCYEFIKIGHIARMCDLRRNLNKNDLSCIVGEESVFLRDAQLGRMRHT